MEVAWFPNSPGVWEKANNQECLPPTWLEQDGNFNYARAPAFSNSAVRAAALPLQQELQKYFVKKRKFPLIPPSTSGATPGKCIAHRWLGAQIQCHLSAIFFLVPRLLLLVNGSILFSFFNVCHPLLRCCWPWNATKSCQRSFWLSGGQQSKHKHSIINKREWVTGQVRHVSPQHAFRVARYLIESVQLCVVPKCSLVLLPSWGHCFWPNMLTQGDLQKEPSRPALLFLLCSYCDFQKGTWGEGLGAGNFSVWHTWPIRVSHINCAT